MAIRFLPWVEEKEGESERKRGESKLVENRSAFPTGPWVLYILSGLSRVYMPMENARYARPVYLCTHVLLLILKSDKIVLCYRGTVYMPPRGPLRNLLQNHSNPTIFVILILPLISLRFIMRSIGLHFFIMWRPRGGKLLFENSKTCNFDASQPFLSSFRTALFTTHIALLL